MCPSFGGGAAQPIRTHLGQDKKQQIQSSYETSQHLAYQRYQRAVAEAERQGGTLRDISERIDDAARQYQKDLADAETVRSFDAQKLAKESPTYQQSVGEQELCILAKNLEGAWKNRVKDRASWVRAQTEFMDRAQGRFSSREMAEEFIRSCFPQGLLFDLLPFIPMPTPAEPTPGAIRLPAPPPSPPPIETLPMVPTWGGARQSPTPTIPVKTSYASPFEEGFQFEPNYFDIATQFAQARIPERAGPMLPPPPVLPPSYAPTPTL